MSRKNQQRFHSVKANTEISQCIFSGTYFTGPSRVFPHLFHKTGTILFLKNVKITICALQVQKLSQIEVFDFNQFCQL